MGGLLAGGAAWSQARTVVHANRGVDRMYVTIFGPGNVSASCPARNGNDAMYERLVVTRTDPASMDVTLR